MEHKADKADSQSSSGAFILTKTLKDCAVGKKHDMKKRQKAKVKGRKEVWGQRGNTEIQPLHKESDNLKRNEEWGETRRSQEGGKQTNPRRTVDVLKHGQAGMDCICLRRRQNWETGMIMRNKSGNATEVWNLYLEVYLQMKTWRISTRKKKSQSWQSPRWQKQDREKWKFHLMKANRRMKQSTRQECELEKEMKSM